MDAIRQRNALMRAIRAFFHENDFVEVETPIRVAAPCLELHIDAEPSGAQFLRTSPELYHKRLLADGYDRIFEWAKCFRQGEYGPLHHPEYTMLEWYRADADYRDVLDDTQELIRRLVPLAKDPARFDAEWTLLSVEEAFLTYAGWNPVKEYDEDRFDMDLVERVEPALSAFEGPVVLIDYPAEAAALSRRKPDRPAVAERWELYINGIELANAYSELIDPVEQRMRFEQCAAQRHALGKPVYALDEAFLAALPSMRPTGGIALGVDRLLMLLLGGQSLNDVLPFR